MGNTSNVFDISKLMSPPEQGSLDCFSKVSSKADIEPLAASSPTQIGHFKTPAVGKGAVVLQGEMISPVSLGGDEVGSEDNGSAQDPILYPNSTPCPHSRPLFADNEVDVVRSHPFSYSSTLFRPVSPPHGGHNEQGVRMKSQLMQRYIANPQNWLAQQREQLRADSRAAAERAERLRIPAIVTRSASSPSMPRRSVSRMPKMQAVAHPVQNLTPPQENSVLSRPVHDSTKRVSKRTSQIVAISRTSIPPRIAPQPKDGPHDKSGAIRTTLRVPGSSPEPRIRTSAPNREDKDFGSLPDCCPPLSTLPERTNLLKVEWKGSPLDLTHDPFKHLLHADELVLAASLRLDCATYLTSKRRMFIRRLECARTPKEFRKTDAQQACKIDVNKASKLWSAFDKVGWLHIDQVRNFI
ncbi:hypothetical protein SEPCBS119000_005682 [Sporothrix epigloea]|uniref:SWIRM domain-containing protein n=1 Tax=Sporothrix epigloea TaxID=1892477 RepID=A0ABP0DZ89_9PEZI